MCCDDKHYLFTQTTTNTQILLRTSFKVRVVRQATRDISLFIHSTYFKGRKMQLEAILLYRSTTSYFPIQGEQKGLADPSVN